jgi:hypothetical protein
MQGLTPDLDYKETIFADFFKQYETIENRLASIEEKMDARHSNIVDVLEAIRDWLREYTPVLNDARDYFQHGGQQQGRQGRSEGGN